MMKKSKIITLFVAVALCLVFTSSGGDKPVHYTFSDYLNIQILTGGIHSDEKDITPGPKDCTVTAELAWGNSTTSDPVLDNEIICGQIMPYGDASLIIFESGVYGGQTTMPYIEAFDHVDLRNRYMHISHSYNPQDTAMFFHWASYFIDAEGDWEDYPNE